MPAQFNYFFKIADTKVPPTIFYETPDKNYAVFERVFPMYNSDNKETAKVIGKYTATYTTITNAEDVITSTKNFLKFNKDSGVPYGDDNILVTTNTRYNKVTDKIQADGKYIIKVSPNESTGEYANQVGYVEYDKDSSKIFAEQTVYFPLPIVTYTNAFNSLPQPSTAPLPA